MNDIMEGDIYLFQDENIKASRIYRSIIDKHPLNVWGYLRVAESLQTLKPSEARDALLQASSIAPASYEIWQRLAKISLTLKESKKAAEYSSRAFQLNPYDPQVKKLHDKLKP